MSFTTVCPNCDSRLTAPDTVLGKRVKCKKCGDPFTARAADEDEEEEEDRPAKATVKTRPKPAREDDDERPRKSTKARRSADEDDDKPRPKSKKKGKKKKEGLPIALVLGIIGGVLLIGGAIVVYFAFIKEDKPADQPVAKGDGPPNRGQPRGGGPGGTVAGTGWVEHVDAEGKYRISFPTQPTAKNQNVTVEGQQLTLKIYQAQLGTEAFVANGAILPNPNLDPGEVIQGAETGAVSQIPNATVTSKNSITHNGVNGRELVLSAQGGAVTGVMRLFVNNGRLYTFVAIGPGMNPDSPNVKRFFGSLKFE